MSSADQQLSFWREEHGQDLIEYALMAGFLAVAVAAILPPMSAHFDRVFSKIHSLLVQHGGG